MRARGPLRRVLASAVTSLALVMQPVPAAMAQTGSTPSRASASVKSHLAKVQRKLLKRGKLKQDVSGKGVPVTSKSLAENFMAIALRGEHGARMKPVIRKWTGPVRVQLHFGKGIPKAAQRKDRSGVSQLMGRLSRASRHPIVSVNGNGNYHVLVLNEDERRNAGSLIAHKLRGTDAKTLAEITKHVRNAPLSRFCMTFPLINGKGGLSRGLAVIRAEAPELLRLSCLHEEITQGLGLWADSYHVRPSIFNDDEEFALLTVHDELLVRMLYDRRVRNGMTRDQVRPVVSQIAQELIPTR